MHLVFVTQAKLRVETDPTIAKCHETASSFCSIACDRLAPSLLQLSLQFQPNDRTFICNPGGRDQLRDPRLCGRVYS